MSHIDAAQHFPCPACGAYAGDQCWPRQPEDTKWCHTDRVKTMEFNIVARQQGLVLI